MRCPDCGESNIPGVDVCDNCGRDLAGLDIPEAGDSFSGRLMTDRIGDLPLKSVIAASPTDTAATAVSRMRAERQGCVLVMTGDELAGIVTEGDVLVRLLRAGRDPETTPVSTIMTSEVHTLTGSDPVAFAMHLMSVEGFRHLPIVEKGRPVGFISVRTLLAYLNGKVTEKGGE